MGRIDTEGVLGNDVEVIAPESAPRKASHGNRGDRVEGQKDGVGRDTRFFPRLSLCGLQARLRIFATARDSLPIVVVRTAKQSELVVALIHCPVRKDQYLKGCPGHSLRYAPQAEP